MEISAAAWNSVTPKKKNNWINILCYVSPSIRIIGMRNVFKLFWILGRKKFAVVHMELKHKNCVIVYEK